MNQPTRSKQKNNDWGQCSLGWFTVFWGNAGIIFLSCSNARQSQEDKSGFDQGGHFKLIVMTGKRYIYKSKKARQKTEANMPFSQTDNDEVNHAAIIYLHIHAYRKKHGIYR